MKKHPIVGVIVATILAIASSQAATSSPSPTHEPIVSVTGAVNRFTRVILPSGKLSIVDAISDAGGGSRQADLTRVTVIRKSAGGRTERIEVNVTAITRADEPLPTFYLQEGDEVFVPTRGRG